MKPGKGKKSAGKKGGKKNLHCNFCDKDGHEEENCWTKHPELRQKKGKNEGWRGEAKFAMTAVLKPASTSEPRKNSSANEDTEWYVDSAASEQFSPHKHLFETYSNLNKPIEIFTSKDGITSHGVGKGRISL